MVRFACRENKDKHTNRWSAIQNSLGTFLASPQLLSLWSTSYRFWLYSSVLCTLWDPLNNLVGCRVGEGSVFRGYPTNTVVDGVGAATGVQERGGSSTNLVCVGVEVDGGVVGGGVWRG